MVTKMHHRTDDDLDRILAEEAVRLRSEVSAIEAQQKQLEDQRAELARRLRHISALLGDERPDPVEQTGLGGVADQVVELLRELGRPMHYREIERELRARGKVHVGGKDPANTLLARYFRDKRLYRPKRGTYALRDEGGEARSVGTRRVRTAKERRSAR